MNRSAALLLCLTSLVVLPLRAGEPAPLSFPCDPARAPEEKTLPLIKPAVPSMTGLLLEPPLELAWFTTEKFKAASATVGPEKIHKKWSSPVTALPPHSRLGAQGLTKEEVKDYMRQVRRLFDDGVSIPISDAGLISTQEDVIRQPMLNHIAAFSNETVRAYLLVQKTLKDKGWSYFSIVQDLTVKPPLDYYGHIKDKEVKFEGRSCYHCHSSGPLAIHPARADLVSDPPLAAALSKYIAEQPLSRFYFPEDNKPAPDYGKPLTLKFCSRCHQEDGDRSPLFKIHSHPIRVLVDFGYMPPNRSLTPAEIAELKAWLEQKP